MKKTLLIDLDGVLNEYNEVYNKDEIPPPRKWVKDFLEKLAKNYELRLFTTRNRLLASKWLIKNKLDKCFYDITNIKEVSWLMIDDRCLKFSGNYNDMIQQIESFEPWYKKQ